MVALSIIFLFQAHLKSLARDHDVQMSQRIGIVRLFLKHNKLEALRQLVGIKVPVIETQTIFLRVIDLRTGEFIESPQMSAILPTKLFEENQNFFSTTFQGLDFRGKSGIDFRIFSLQFTQDGVTRIVQAGIDRTADREILSFFMGEILLLLLAAVLGSGLIGFIIARQSINPIFSITKTAEKVHSGNLGDRIQLTGLPAELHDLGTTMNSMLSRLEESFLRLSQFSSDIAHELRTPVNNIRGLVEISLSEGFDLDKTREMLYPCLDECNRLSKLIDNLLFLYRTENPQTKIDRKKIPLSQAINDVWEYFEPQTLEADIKFLLEVEENLILNADLMTLQRALGNLIENALKHTPKGGNIWLRAFSRKDDTTIEVENSGQGVPAEHLTHLFDRFYRVDYSRTDTAKGYGLGLSIVQGILKLHGGTVEVKSTIGVGATFSMHFPAL